MKALLINSTTRTLSEIEIRDWQDISPAIGCETFDYVGLNDDHGVYVDDEGLYNSPLDFFQIGDGQPIAGNGLVLGCNDNGYSVDCTITPNVKFLNLWEVRAWATAQTSI